MAVAVFVVVVATNCVHVYVQVSVASRVPLLFVSPDGADRGTHLSSVTPTALSDTSPGLVTLYVYVTDAP
jgi:hypothetical protein